MSKGLFFAYCRANRRLFVFSVLDARLMVPPAQSAAMHTKRGVSMYSSIANHVARALTIAGSDSGGGAGIQADLKTMQQFGVYGVSVITALTAQNTIGVQGVYEVSRDFVEMQLHSVLTDIGADAVKTGMLANEDAIDVVADVLSAYRVGSVVMDPVMVAKGGERLLASSSVSALCHRLLPKAGVVTPNVPEASVLCDRELATWDDYHEAARRIAAMGPSTVIVKGGHMAQEAVEATDWHKHVKHPASVDIVFSMGQWTYFVTPRVQTANTHGTGCTYSAAITSMLARGSTVLDAIAAAKRFVYGAIANAVQWDVGSGHGPVDHSAPARPVYGIEADAVYVLDNWTWVRIR